MAGAEAAAAVGAAAKSEPTPREGGSAQKGVEGVAEGAARQASGLHEDRLRRGLPLRNAGDVRALDGLQELYKSAPYASETEAAAKAAKAAAEAGGGGNGGGS